MTILLTFPGEKAPGSDLSALSGGGVQVSFVDSGVRIMAVEPVSWGAIAIYYLGKFADSFVEAAGKELGSQFGSWLAERLGFGGSSSAEDIKKILDAFVQRMSVIIKREFAEQQFREAHELLAATSRQFEEFLLVPAAVTLDSLNGLELQTNLAYEKVKNLGSSALPSLCRAGTMLITLTIRKYGMTQSADMKPIATKRIDEVLADIEKFLGDVRSIYEKRAVGPSELTLREWCEDNTPGTGLPGAGPTGNSGTGLLAVGGEFRDVPAIGVTIEGESSYFPAIADPCGKRVDTRASALASANARLGAARSVHNEELERVFLAPAAAIRDRADALKKQLSAP